jgi:hypothetical protein
MKATGFPAILIVSCMCASIAPAQASSAQPDAAAAQPAPTPTADAIRQQAKALTPLVTQPAAVEFLNAAHQLPEPPSRTVYRNRDKGIALSAAEWNQLSEADRAGLTAKVYPPEFFYSTGYGSPLVYVRVLDIAGRHGLTSLKERKVMDFGAGTIGHLRAMALAGAQAHGVDVEPLFRALYSDPSDQGPVSDGSHAAAWLHIGQWPAQADVVKKVGTGFDLITSKNTLKEGYIHPKPPEGKTADPRQLITLGVDDAAFLKSIHYALNAGGLFVIYNICPAQSDAKDLSKPYIPWADGKSPFSREQFAAAGLDILEFDIVDSSWAIDAFTALGYHDGASKDQMAQTTFCWYTVVKRPGAPITERK